MNCRKGKERQTEKKQSRKKLKAIQIERWFNNNVAAKP